MLFLQSKQLSFSNCLNSLFFFFNQIQQRSRIASKKFRFQFAKSSLRNTLLHSFNATFKFQFNSKAFAQFFAFLDHYIQFSFSLSSLYTRFCSLQFLSSMYVASCNQFYFTRFDHLSKKMRQKVNFKKT